MRSLAKFLIILGCILLLHKFGCLSKWFFAISSSKDIWLDHWRCRIRHAMAHVSIWFHSSLVIHIVGDLFQYCLRIRIVTSTLVPINYVGTPAKKVLFHCFAFVDFQTWDRGEFLYQSFRSKICYKSVFIHEWVGVMLSCISSINSYEIALRVNLNRSRSSYFYQQHLSCFSRLL